MICSLSTIIRIIKIILSIFNKVFRVQFAKFMTILSENGLIINYDLEPVWLNSTTIPYNIISPSQQETSLIESCATFKNKPNDCTCINLIVRCNKPSLRNLFDQSLIKTVKEMFSRIDKFLAYRI